MSTTRIRTALSVTSLLAVGLLLTPSATSRTMAAPRIVMFYGEPLPAAVYLTDWAELGHLQTLLSYGETYETSKLRDRPYLKVAMFWGSDWNDYLEQGRSVTALAPAEARQHGRLYLGSKEVPAVFIDSFVSNALGTPPAPMPLTLAQFGRARIVWKEAIEILFKRGVPTSR
jgi:hypothetical protein